MLHNFSFLCLVKKFFIYEELDVLLMVIALNFGLAFSVLFGKSLNRMKVYRI